MRKVRADCGTQIATSVCRRAGVTSNTHTKYSKVIITSQLDCDSNLIIFIFVISAKEAHSKFTLKDYSLTRGVALYEAELLTGRTHQLRIQFSDAGAPIIADPYYNPMFVEFLQSGAAASEAPLGIASPLEMGLQAHALRFSHPHQPAQLINLRLPIPQKWKTIVSEVKTKSNWVDGKLTEVVHKHKVGGEM